MRKYIFALTVALVSVFINISSTLAACAPPAVGGDMVLRFPAAQGVWVGSASHMTGNVINTDLTTGGILYYDTTDNALKLCDGNDWVTLGAGSGGGTTSLAALTDVDITGATNGQTIVFDSASGKWVPGTATSGGGSGSGALNLGPDIKATMPADQTLVNACVFAGNPTLTVPKSALYYVAISGYGYMHSGNIRSLSLKFKNSSDVSVFEASTGFPSTAGQYIHLGKTGLVHLPSGTYSLSGNATDSSSCGTTNFNRLISANVTINEVIGGGSGSGASTLSALTDVDVTGATAGQSLVFNGTKWGLGAMSGGGSSSGFAAKFIGAIPTTLQPITSYTASYNAGGGLNPTSGVFTAPQAGLYAFDATSYIIATGGGSLDLWVYAVKGGVEATICRSFRGTSPTGNYFHSCAGMLDLAAGDTVYVRAMNSAMSSSGEIYFSGALQGGGGGSGEGTSSGPAAAGATGNIQFKGADGNLAADVGITWDNTQKRLYLGSSDALGNLSVIGHSSFRQDNTGSGVGLVVERSADHSSPPRLGLSKSRGTREAPEDVINGDQLGSINFQGYRGGAYTAYGSSSAASIVAEVTGTVTATTIPTSLIFATTAQDGTKNTEHMRISPSGYIGIGTAAPVSLLHISSADDVASASSSQAMMRIANTSNADNRPTIRLQKADALSGNRYADIRLNNMGTLEFAAGTSSNSLEPVKLALTGIGDVGIGTSAPQARLHVAGGGYTQTRAPYTGGISMNIDDYSTARASIVLDINAANGIGVGSDYMYIAQTAHIGSLHSAHNTPLSLGSNSDHVRVTTDGRVLVGTTATNLYTMTSGNGGIEMKPKLSANSGAALLVANGYSEGWANMYLAKYGSHAAAERFIAFYSNNTQIGTITAPTASSISYNTTSDYRLKENITPVSAALERVSALKPRHYNFKSDPNHPMDGFIAHELQAIAPYAVSGDKDAKDAQGNPIYQQVDYGKLTPLLAAAIQELEAEIQALRAEIQALKSAQ